MTHKLIAEPRKVTGRKVKSLRREGLVPGNVFGKDITSYTVQLKADEFKKIYDTAGETSIIELTVGKSKTAPVLISNIQHHPITGDPVHVDFRQVDLTKKITAMVPVELIGESPAEKAGIGTVVQQITELEVEALPTNLPDKFEVDISSLAEVDAALFVKDLKYDKAKVAIEATDDQLVAKVEPPQKEEEIAPPAPEEAEEGVEAPVTEEGAEAKEEASQEGKEEPKE